MPVRTVIEIRELPARARPLSRGDVSRIFGGCLPKGEACQADLYRNLDCCSKKCSSVWHNPTGPGAGYASNECE